MHLVLLTGFVATAFAESPTDWRIEAGPVRIDPGESAQVSGTFVVYAPEDTPPAAAPRTGGACLVANLVPFGVGLANCTADSDCNGPEAIDANDPRLEGSTGYCLARDGGGSRQCWTRPGPPRSHCKRSVDGFQLTAGVHEIGPVNADPIHAGPPSPEWAVYACIADEGHDRACGQESGPHRQTSLTPNPMIRD